ncbi:hypothetical protein J7T55_014785 [Diaporthe amygdali]|uniref:uncharacterized protein n=1 Tax=Phomopsis amygdali TaxID=1214568 RepID=UPI0022FE4D87|nr:uncharacterized protein J7T55_014785 [Diaporthe amygdali]KAJ0109983.1 hypothetical protein J7T55_014785 [Diaporthe amygdali]
MDDRQLNQQNDDDLLSEGFGLAGFGADHKKGALDQYCGMERAFYFVALGLLLSYIIVIILSVLRVCELRMVPKDKVDDMLREREEMINLEHKIHDQEASAATPTHSMTPTTPQGNHEFGATDTQPYSHHSSTRETTRDAAASSSTRPARPQLRYADSIPGPSSSSSYRTPRPTEPVSPLSPVSPISTAALPHDQGFILSATDVSANLAMVADGSRYSPNADHNQLPPYSPGNRGAMRGHGTESNDIRLSEYVKGATAAQDMKDSHGF